MPTFEMLIKRRLLGVSEKVIFLWKVHTLPLCMEFSHIQSFAPKCSLAGAHLLDPIVHHFFHIYQLHHTKRSVYVNVVISHESHVCFQFTYST
jgi:hypothetical protein